MCQSAPVSTVTDFFGLAEGILANDPLDAAFFAVAAAASVC